jgi:hypothetical protein
MYSRSIFFCYAGYRSFTCPTSYDLYVSYGEVAIWGSLLAVVGKVMTYACGNLRECDQKRLYPVL